MTTSASIENYSGQVTKAIRLYHGLTQTDFAGMLDVSQSALSKLEAGTLELSATQWMFLCTKFAIDPNALLTGYIINLPTEPTVVKKRISGFLMPTKYAKDFKYTVRYIYPLVTMLKSTLGKDAFYAFLKRKLIPKEYFCIANNPVSMDMFRDIYLELSINAKLDLNKVEIPLGQLDYRRVFNMDPHDISSIKFELKVMTIFDLYTNLFDKSFSLEKDYLNLKMFNQKDDHKFTFSKNFNELRANLATRYLNSIISYFKGFNCEFSLIMGENELSLHLKPL